MRSGGGGSSVVNLCRARCHSLVAVWGAGHWESSNGQRHSAAASSRNSLVGIQFGSLQKLCLYENTRERCEALVLNGLLDCRVGHHSPTTRLQTNTYMKSLPSRALRID